MLITFQTKSAADVVMFGDVALELLARMGRDKKVPSAMAAEDIPDAVKKLRQSIEDEQGRALETDSQKIESQRTVEDEQGEEEDDRTVSLAQRAQPLIQLFEAASRNDDPVMWDN